MRGKWWVSGCVRLFSTDPRRHINNPNPATRTGDSGEESSNSIAVDTENALFVERKRLHQIYDPSDVLVFFFLFWFLFDFSLFAKYRALADDRQLLWSRVTIFAWPIALMSGIVSRPLLNSPSIHPPSTWGTISFRP